MKPIFTGLFLFIALISFSQAPYIQWEKSLGGSNIDLARSIDQTNDSGCIVAGYTQSSDGDVTGFHKNKDVWVVKLDANGNIQWQKSLGGSGDEEAYAVKQTFDGGYVLAGYTGSNDGDVIGHHGSNDAWVIKLDSNGNITWQKCLGTKAYEAAYDIQQTSDSGYVIAGAIDSATVIKLNKYSNVEWQYIPQNTDGPPLSIVETLDKGYAMAENSDTRLVVVKIDSAGEYVWRHTAGLGWAAEYANKIKLTPKGGFVVVGGYSPYDGGDDGGPGGVFAKFDENGNLLINKDDGGSNQGEEFNDIEIVSDSFKILSTADPYYDPSNYYQQDNYVVYDIDKVGYVHAEKLLGGTSDDMASSMSCKSNNGCIIAGTSNSTDGDVTGNHGNYDFWVVKLKDEVILPVKLLSFTVQKQNNTTLLNWQTANEINNDHFSIERSADSKLFTSIGNKPATNNALRSNYSFVDNAHLNGMNYYRLKQVDKDGKFSYSKIVSVDFAISNNALFSISPNPAKDHISITSSVAVSDAQITITSATGRTLYASKHSFTSGEQLNVPVVAMANQTLFVTVNTSNGKQTFKVMKE